MNNFQNMDYELVFWFIFIHFKTVKILQKNK
jgi:hypothetical protein